MIFMPLVVWILLGVIIVIVIWFIASYNSLVKLRVLYEEAFSGMDVFIKKRYDLIPSLVETVKGYAAHESKTLDSVVSARSRAISAGNADSIESRNACESELTGALSRLMVVVEQYPALKADSQFLNLSQQLSSIETDISQARKYYNGTVRMYNIKLAIFPVSIVASIGRFIKQPFFELENASERDTPQVSF